ncbi:rRNA maturation RNase YbeY [Chondrinema litorale]|uniref:rRNA maturation RNase YbeY n=1 Tax=Chondrinema litorale TaxID=2994555 RepID=UPI00254305C4|nr:rRNA maturation RNase YbeY [Chondrinema litorale]UZR96219.1 rRNA maturation RNase YbeY [Chondrinema litorale]
MFFYEDLNDFELHNSSLVADWISEIVQKNNYSISNANVIFCSDTYLHEINLQYLQHDTYTDIVTFNNSDVSNEIDTDIFISVDRVQENADNLNISFVDELHRVIIHGFLHLVGFNDKSKADKEIMRQEETAALSKRKFI